MSTLPLNIFSTTEERVSAIENELMLANRKIDRLQESEMKLEEEIGLLKKIVREMKDEKNDKKTKKDKKLINSSNHTLFYKLETD
jgi:phage shock protein A